MAGSINNSLMIIVDTLLALSLGRRPGVAMETGTYKGESALILSRFFQKVHTIELSKKWFNYAKKRLEENKKISLHLGDSSNILPEILPRISESVFFYLDAHFAGGDTAYGSKEVPLHEELTAICERKYQDIIVIDDLKRIGKKGKGGAESGSEYKPLEYDWRDITLDGIAKITGRGIENVWFFKGDRLIIFRNKTKVQGFLLLFWIYIGTFLDLLMVKPYKSVRASYKRLKSSRIN